jgi:hypothetical protein
MAESTDGLYLTEIETGHCRLLVCVRVCAHVLGAGKLWYIWGRAEGFIESARMKLVCCVQVSFAAIADACGLDSSLPFYGFHAKVGFSPPPHGSSDLAALFSVGGGRNPTRTSSRQQLFMSASNT